MATSLAWPPVLPRPQLGIVWKPRPNAVRSDIPSGLPQARRRSRQVPNEMPVRWVMSDFQAAVFDAWLELEAFHGTRWFAMDLLGSVGITSHEVRFKGGAGGVELAELTPRYWTVTATIEIRDRLLLPLADYEALKNEDGTALQAALRGLDKLVNEDLQ